MNLHTEFSRVTKAFEKRKIRYAVVGGLAMAFHDEPRCTMDIDLLVHSEDQQRMKRDDEARVLRVRGVEVHKS